jgi:hypothetical protein
LFLKDCAEMLCNIEGHTLRREEASGAGAPGVGGRFALDELSCR